MTAKETGFLQLRRGLWEHARDGRLGPSEGWCFLYICSQADTRTGIWRGSAGALAGELGLPARTAAHILERLERAGYIRRFAVPGKHVCYPILVHKFLITSGEHKGEQLDAASSSSPTSLRYMPIDIREQQGEHEGEQQGEQVAGQKRSKNREEILNTIRSDYADTQLSASEIARREPKVAACAAPRQRREHWPEGFSLTDKLRGYALEHGVPAGEVDSQFEHFENFHKAKGSRFMDWNRAWYTWVGNYKQFARGARHGESSTERRRREADEQTARVVAMLQAKRAK